MNRRVSFPVLGRLLSALSPCRGYHPGVTMTEDELRAPFHTPDGKPRVSGRPYLPGSLGAGMPESLDGPREDLPYAIDMSKAAEGGLTESLVANTKSLIKEHIPRYGALLFKGLPIRTKEDYSLFNKALGLRFMPYKGGLGVRNEVADTVMTASREPPPFTIELHNEMSCAPVWPKYLSFCCDVPPAPGCGGESVLLRNSDLKRDLDPEVVEKFKRLQIRYTQFLPSKTEGCYHSWQEAFQTSEKGGAEDWMKEMGYLFEWGADNSVFFWYNIAATRRHHTTGEEVWFNHAHMNKTFFDGHPFWGALRDISADKLPYHTKYGDGSDIEPDVMQHIRNCTWKNTIGVQLEKGELLFLDNMAVQHGRLGFVGDRKLLLTLSDDHL